MTTTEEKDKIIKAIKNCNISKLESYVDKNGITLNMWCVMFYVPIVETLKVLLENHATLDLVKSTINDIKKNRNYLKEMIKNNNLKDVEDYVKANDISVKELKNEDFDILICSIENDASSEMINYIINRFQYKTFNYFNNQKNLIIDKGDTPLFFTLAKNNFKLANVLLKNGADINYNKGKLLCQLVEEHALNMKNLKFVFNHGYQLEYLDRFVIFLIQHYVSNETVLPDALDLALNYYIFDNAFILNLLNFHKYKTPISTKQLKYIVEEELHKIVIKDEWYKEAVAHEHYNGEDAINILLERDRRNHELVLKQIGNYYHEINSGYIIDEVESGDNFYF